MSTIHPLLSIEGLLDVSVRTSLLLLVALAATTAMRRAPAAARHMVWTVALGGVLLLPLLSAVLPPLTLPILPHASTSASTGTAPAPPPVEARDAPAVNATATLPRPLETAAASTGIGPETARLRWGISEWVLALWAAGLALAVVRLISGLVKLAVLERRARMVTDAGWLGLAHQLAARLGLHRGVTLLSGDRGTVPMTWGVLQPAVWLPSAADEWTDERRTVVLAHELAHVRRKDALTQWLAHLALALHWFNPLVWMAVRRQRDERERACDDAVLALGTPAPLYADHLLEMVRLASARHTPALGMAMARRSQFEGRLLAILDRAGARGASGGAATVWTLLLGLLAIVPAAVARPVPAPPRPIEASAEAFLDRPAAPLDAEASRMPLPGARPASAESPRAGAAPPVDTGRVRPRSRAEVSASDREMLAEVARASRTIDSPSARARVLVELAAHPGLDDAGTAALLESAAGIDSDSNRRAVLVALLDRPRLTASHQVAALRTAGEIASSSERGAVLRHFLQRFRMEDPPARTAFFAALRSIGSDHARRTLLENVLRSQELCEENLLGVIATAGALSSDHDKRTVLVATAGRAELTGPLRDAYLAAARTIASDTDRAHALSALVERNGASALKGPISKRQALWTADLALNGDHLGRRSFELSIRAHRVVRGSAPGTVAEILPGGYLRIDHRTFAANPDHSPVHRILAASRGADGGIEWRYRVDGVARPWDEEGLRWLTALLRSYT